MLVHHEFPSGRQDGNTQIALQIFEHLAAAIVKREGRQPRHPRERMAKQSGRQRCGGWSADGPHSNMGDGRLFAPSGGFA